MPALTALAADSRPGTLDVRSDFPALDQTLGDHRLVYLDSAATALKPRAVINAVRSYYESYPGSVHRGLHALSRRATDAFEAAREAVRGFLRAPSADEIVFVRGATEGLNLIAESWARPRIEPGDRIVVTGLEHHSNLVPWQRLASSTGAELVLVPVDASGDVPLAGVEACLNSRTRLVSIAHVSNALGTLLDVRAIASLARSRGARVVVDGAQAAPHLAVDVEALGCDFYVLSSHKLYGPSGVGVLWASRARLDEMAPYQVGSNMVVDVRLDGATFADGAARFEAGTPNIEGVIGLGAAIRYLDRLGLPAVEAHERSLLAYAETELRAVPGLRVLGEAARRVGLVSFVVDGIHPHDLATVLDDQGIAVRAGHQCAQPALARFGVSAVTRASFGVYNGRADVDALVLGLHRARALFEGSS